MTECILGTDYALGDWKPTFCTWQQDLGTEQHAGQQQCQHTPGRSMCQCMYVLEFKFPAAKRKRSAAPLASVASSLDSFSRPRLLVSRI